MANSQEPKHPPATPSSGQGSKIVRSPILRPEVNPDDATPTQGPRPRRHLPAHLGCDGLRGVRVGIMGAGSRRRSGRFGVLVSGRRVLDRPADPSRPVLAAVTTFYLATIWSLILS